MQDSQEYPQVSSRFLDYHWDIASTSAKPVCPWQPDRLPTYYRRQS